MRMQQYTKHKSSRRMVVDGFEIGFYLVTGGATEYIEIYSVECRGRNIQRYLSQTAIEEFENVITKELKRKGEITY